MAAFKERWGRARDRLGKAVRLEAFESFYLYLDASDCLILHGCESIARCSDTEVTATGQGRRVLIDGVDLQVRSLDRTELEVSGRINILKVMKIEPDVD